MTNTLLILKGFSLDYVLKLLGENWDWLVTVKA